MRSTKSHAAITLAIATVFLALSASSSEAATLRTPKAVATAIARKHILSVMVDPILTLDRKMGEKVSKKKLTLNSVTCATEQGSSINNCKAKGEVTDAATGKPWETVEWDFTLAHVNGKWISVGR